MVQGKHSYHSMIVHHPTHSTHQSIYIHHSTHSNHQSIYQHSIYTILLNSQSIFTIYLLANLQTFFPCTFYLATNYLLLYIYLLTFLTLIYYPSVYFFADLQNLLSMYLVSKYKSSIYPFVVYIISTYFLSCMHSIINHLANPSNKNTLSLPISFSKQSIKQFIKETSMQST